MLMIAPFTNLVDSLIKLLINWKMIGTYHNRLVRIIIDWYVSNYFKPNPDIWHLLLSYTGNDHNL